MSNNPLRYVDPYGLCRGDPNGDNPGDNNNPSDPASPANQAPNNPSPNNGGPNGNGPNGGGAGNNGNGGNRTNPSPGEPTSSKPDFSRDPYSNNAGYRQAQNQTVNNLNLWGRVSGNIPTGRPVDRPGVPYPDSNQVNTTVNTVGEYYRGHRFDEYQRGQDAINNPNKLD